MKLHWTCFYNYQNFEMFVDSQKGIEDSQHNQFYNFAKIAKLTYFVDKCNRDNYEFMYFIRTNIHNEQWPGKSNLIQDIRNSKVKSVSQLSGFQWSPDELFDTNYKERIFYIEFSKIKLYKLLFETDQKTQLKLYTI